MNAFLNNFSNDFFHKNIFNSDLIFIYKILFGFYSIKYFLMLHKILKENNNKIVKLENRINKIEERALEYRINKIEERVNIFLECDIDNNSNNSVD